MLVVWPNLMQVSGFPSDHYFELLERLGFSSNDEAQLRRALPVVASGLDEVAARFQRQLAGYSSELDDEGILADDRQRMAIVRWLQSFFMERRDATYFARVCELAVLHLARELRPGALVASMRSAREEIASMLLRAPEVDGALTLAAFGKAFDLDLAVMLEVCCAANARPRAGLTDALVAGLAHEIRNPLNGAQLHLTFLHRRLARDYDAADLVEAVEVASGEIKRLSNLVTELLAFADPSPLHRVTTDVRAICSAAAATMDGASSNIRFILDLPALPVRANLDRERFTEVVSILLRNACDAVDATVESAGTVTLRASHHASKVVVEVEDDGVGVTDPNAPLFDPFFTTKPHGGGLGLAIAQRLVADHGGRLTFTSGGGKTTFRIALAPYAPDEVEEKA